jgi:tRNA modification GTPase
MNQDTICGIATVLSGGAINIIRMSGSKSLNILESLFSKDVFSLVPRQLTYGHILDHEEVVDEVMVAYFKSPNSYTKEDVIEIQCHGGAFVTKQIYELLLNNGAVPSDPGEFTYRAFMNGRIDLTQAESVMDLIEADSRESLKIAHEGLSGKLKNYILSLSNALLNIIGILEVNIDYPEYDDVEILTQETLKPMIESLLTELNDAYQSRKTGRILKEGIKTAIIGKPNVGKSSLLNAMLEEEKAIVTNVEGTTRDIVEGTVNIGGLILHLMDTAGIRFSENQVEQIGIQKSLSLIGEADLLIIVLDQSSQLSKDEIELLENTKNHKRIVVLNKNDLPKVIEDFHLPVVSMSAFKKDGLDELSLKIKDLFVEQSSRKAPYIANERHGSLIFQAITHLNDALSSINQAMPVDIIAIDLMAAWNALGDITGKSGTEHLLDELFSNFCLGK